MNFRTLISLLLLLTITITTAAFAQVNYTTVIVDQMTDAQIRQLMQHAAGLGYSDAQLPLMAASQGMPLTEVEKLKNRIQKIRSGQSGQNPAQHGRNFTDTINTSGYGRNVVGDTLGSRGVYGSVPRIFGEELFRNSRITFEPNLRMATPRGYIIGPDDELIIDLTGNHEVSYNLKVSPEGQIKVQYVGLISVGGLTIEQAISKIRRSMAANYPDLLNGGTNINVNLGNIRSIRITIIGEAMRPGTYTISSLATAFNALYASGGPNRNGSFRAIEIIRNNKVISTIDVYNFLLKGIQSNIRLQDHDVINVPVYRKRVEISGEVKRPALFEVLDSESLQDVIDFAGGFSSRAYSATIKVLQNTKRERQIADVDESRFTSYKPQNGDKYIVDSILTRFSNRVELSGAVFRPGDFELEEGMTLKTLIAKADGLREDAFLSSAYILRLNSDNSLAMIPFNLDEIIRGSKPDIVLQREDKVKISSIFDLQDEYRVEIQGEVRSPGLFLYAENMTLESAIQMAGGFRDGASPNRVEISRRVRNSNAISSNATIAEIFVVNLNRDLSLAGNPFVLNPFDIVSVRNSAGYEVQKQVKIEGEVLHPGTYTIQNKDEKISDLITRAGGITSLAFAEGASLRRPGRVFNALNDSLNVNASTATDNAEEQQQRLRSLQRLQQQRTGVIDTNLLKQDLENDYVGIDLAKIMTRPGSTSDLPLEDGDVLRVPKILKTIKISGEVLKPTNIVYERGKNLAEYVNESGGFTYNAKKRSAYVEYANGGIKSTQKFLLFHNYPEIKPGAQIFVPRRRPKEQLGIQALVGVSSAIVSLVVVVVALLK